MSPPELRPYRLHLQRPWVSGRESFAARSGWLVRVWDGRGRIGLGDCAPLPAAGTESAETARRELERARDRWPGGGAAEALLGLDGWGPRSPAARCALETALLDLQARQSGCTLAAALSDCPARRVTVNAAVGTLGPGLAERLGAAAAAGYRVHKVKAGLAAVADELAALEEAAAALPAGHRLRIDANGAWDETAAGRFLDGLAGLPVESLEEPLAGREPEAFIRLQARAACRLALDESLAAVDPEPLLASPYPGRLVLKPAALGGPLPALRLARRARAAGWDAVVTTVVESAVGAWAALHLAAAVAGEGDGEAPAHGLATSAWLAEDVAPPPTVADGGIALPGEAGLGVAV